MNEPTTEELIDKLRKSAKCVYLACDAAVATELAETMNLASARLSALSQAVPAPAAQEQEAAPIWERIAEAAESLPDEAIAGIPTDGATQHDHYLYGSDKRPAAPAPAAGEHVCSSKCITELEELAEQEQGRANQNATTIAAQSAELARLQERLQEIEGIAGEMASECEGLEGHTQFEVPDDECTVCRALAKFAAYRQQHPQEPTT